MQVYRRDAENAEKKRVRPRSREERKGIAKKAEAAIGLMDRLVFFARSVCTEPAPES
jgi:hypothetical protein